MSGSGERAADGCTEWPIGFAPLKKRRAKASLTIATRGAPSRSRSVKTRPATRRWRYVAKNPGVTWLRKALRSESAPAPVEDRFDFDLPVRAEDTPVDTETLLHEPLPDFAREHERHAAESAIDQHVEAPAEPQPEHTLVATPDELFVGEDAIGTKLDLAKAYLDMGDPEGARSMLDEVMSEGNDSQKDEARKLLAEIK